jgi:hypothetical protein
VNDPVGRQSLHPGGVEEPGYGVAGEQVPDQAGELILGVAFGWDALVQRRDTAAEVRIIAA